jgi:hypothetical protein
MTLIDAIRHGELFARFFPQLDSWRAWLTVLRSIFGLPLDQEELELFRRCTGRTGAFNEPVAEAWLICGRRSGKSYIAALIAVFLATFRDYSACLAPGERGVVMLLACDRDQARVILRYISAFIDDVPALAAMVMGRTAESLDLSNGISIEVHTSSFRSVRGRTLVAALADECAYWRADDSRNPDKAVLDALRPAMATIPNALLLCLSSPYARSGALYEAFERHHGNDASDVLVWRAPTVVMNPTIRQRVIDRAFENDPQAAAAEWDAEFRSDVQSFLEESWITDATDPGCHERPAADRFDYVCFADPSGGKKDSYTFAIAHKQGELALLDVAREFKAPLDPAVVTAEIAKLVKPYGIRKVIGDAYAGEWPAAAFREHGLTYELSELSRSEIYLETGPMLAQGRARLIDFPRLASQMRQLERRTAPGGRDRVNHPPGGHDDIANSAMGAIRLAGKKAGRSVRRDQASRPKFALM